MPIPILALSLLWWIPFKPNLHEAGSLEYIEIGLLILFWTRLKTRCSSDSWGPWQKYPPFHHSWDAVSRIYLALSSFADDLSSCFPEFFLCHLSQFTTHWWFGSQINITQLRNRVGSGDMTPYIEREVIDPESVYSFSLFQVKKHWLTVPLMQMRGQLRESKMVFPSSRSWPLQWSHRDFSLNFSSRFSLGMSPCSYTFIYYL